MPSNRLNQYGEQGAGLFVLKSYLFYLRKDSLGLIYQSRFLFSLRLYSVSFLGFFLLLDSLHFSNCDISSTVALGIHPPFALLLLCFN